MAEATPIHHCWQGPEGQVHCDHQKRDGEAEPLSNVSYRRQPSHLASYNPLLTQLQDYA